MMSKHKLNTEMPISFNDFKQFLVANNVLAIAAGLAFGQATLQLIKSFVADIMLPSAYLAVVTAIRVAHPLAFPTFENKLHPTAFLGESITYLAIVASAFFLINNIFKDFVLDGEVSVKPASKSNAIVDTPPDISEGFSVGKHKQSSGVNKRLNIRWM